MADKITRAAYARHRGCSKAYITKLVNKGIITLDQNNKLNAEEADAQVAQNSDPNYYSEGANAEPDTGAAAADDGEKKGVTFNTAKTMETVYKARLAKLDYELKSGQVVPLEDVNAMQFTAARVARDILMNLPDRLAPAIVCVTDVDKIHKLLTIEIESALEELANG